MLQQSLCLTEPHVTNCKQFPGTKYEKRRKRQSTWTLVRVTINKHLFMTFPWLKPTGMPDSCLPPSWDPTKKKWFSLNWTTTSYSACLLKAGSKVLRDHQQQINNKQLNNLLTAMVIAMSIFFAAKYCQTWTPTSHKVMKTIWRRSIMVISRLSERDKW